MARKTTSVLRVDVLEWTKLDENLSICVLNGSTESGPHTAILKSRSRSPNPLRGQYHPVDEEFYCLDGGFTFDGTTWFSEGAYAYYPANFVHGGRVHVKDGYLLYLRMSGLATINWVEDPKYDSPYLIRGHSSDRSPIQATAHELSSRLAQGNTASPLGMLAMATNPRTGEGTAIFDWRENQSGTLTLVCPGYLEIFAHTGEYRSEDQTIEPHAYLCQVGRTAKLTLQLVKSGRLLISYGGELEIYE